MRLLLMVISALLAAGSASAVDLGNMDDAGLHAVQFVSPTEGWAAGDDGIIWHTTDAGRHWARQLSGTHATLYSLQFLDANIGWAAGREEWPSGSVGVLIRTVDGGLTWRELATHQLPGLSHIRFLDARRGYAVGDSSDQFSTGVFRTTDGGRSWQPLRGKAGPGWRTADFGADGGILGGAWNRLATCQNERLADAEVDPIEGRNVNAVRLQGNRAVAVTEGGLVLLSDTAGKRWRIAELHLPPAIRDDWDFHAVHVLGESIWVVGRPGSAVLHSRDRGKTWETLATGQTLPLDAVCFSDEQHGWAVGALGSILATEDGGKGWRVQHQGGQRAAVLCIHSSSSALPLDTVARIGGQDGYLAVGLCVNRADPESAAPKEASADRRLTIAIRQAGGASGEVLWQFPLAEHQFRADADQVLAGWDRLHDDRAKEALTRQLVLTLRTWRPSVVLVDSPDAGAWPVQQLIARAIRTAFTQAADPASFPEQLRALGLRPWQAGKLYGVSSDARDAQVTVDTTEPCPRLEATARNFATAAEALLNVDEAASPARRAYRIYENRLTPAAANVLMGGIPSIAEARRHLNAIAAAPAVIRAIHERRNLEAIASVSNTGLANPSALLSQIVPMLARLPDDRAADALFTITSGYAESGHHDLARELFETLAQRYPTSPHALDAYRWLIRDASSSEQRRREELDQRLIVTNIEVKGGAPAQAIAGDGLKSIPIIVKGGPAATGTRSVGILADASATRKHFQKCLALGTRLAGQGDIFANDPAIQFSLQAAHRQLGDFDTARLWYERFVQDHPDGSWHDAAAAELWLSARYGLPPKAVAYCPGTDTRPYLDGLLDDACWQNVKPLSLRDVAGTTARAYPTEAWLSYDKNFLYLAVRCRHPSGQAVPPVSPRPRDADLRPYDRVSLMLDLDRDYGSYFCLEIDERGCACDAYCQGEYRDLSWNPQWFVAVHSTPTGWQAEAAIPLTELTGEPVTVGHAWACNLVRIIPGHGVQAWSTPAGIRPRPEGMGLLMFGAEPKRR